jgi:hypothetical protein
VLPVSLRDYLDVVIAELNGLPDGERLPWVMSALNSACGILNRIYIVCDKHLERTDAASKTSGGRGCHLADSKYTLLPFIVAHAGCPIRIVSEHDADSHDEKFTDCTEDNVADMARKERDDQNMPQGLR